jgi:spore germination protein YaaH
MQAYLRSAATNPDAALVGTGWIDPTNGSLIRGSNHCVDGSDSMDSVVQLVHSKGGMAYLTITMDTEDPDAWTHQQAADYIDQATTNSHYIDTIVQEVTRANYDGVIMDLEGVDSTHPNIQQLFATYNQHLHAALQALHKWYGIALIHKVSDHDDTYRLNAFEDWRLLAPTADFLVIMALDESIFTPGPGVSLDWLKQMVAYALQTMPDMLPRLIWELPLYGSSWHLQAGNWVSDGSVTYQQAQALLQQVSPAQTDASASNVNDSYTPHLVYTDASGVKHALWYFTPKSLYNLAVSFQQILSQKPQFDHGLLRIAVWWRTTQEPQEFWSMLDTLYSDG